MKCNKYIFTIIFDYFVFFFLNIQSRGTLRRQTAKKLLTHHLYFCMRDFGHRIGDDAEIYFYLYDGSTGGMRAVSERFLVRISKDGFSNYVEKLNSNCCVFTDLGNSSFKISKHLQ